jgi:DNA polymerase I
LKYDRLIYGKNDLEHIVCVEPKNDKTYIFIEKPNGERETKIVPNRYWILAPFNIGGKFSKMEGDLHFKWGKQYTDWDTFVEERRKFYPMGIYSIFNPKEAFLVKDGYTYYKGSKPTEVSVLSFDIETTGLTHDETSEVLLISNTYRNSTGEVIKKLFAYDNYNNTGEMIDDWCNWVRDIDPSIILGHNIFSYDLPYLAYVSQRYGTSVRLGRNESPMVISNNESKFRVDGTRDLHYHKITIWGRELIDTMFLSYRYDVGKKYDTYGLKNIIRQEGLEKESRVFYDASQIRFNYTNIVEWEKIKEYCKDDADDSLALFDLMIPSYFYMTQSVPKNFQNMFESATGGQINNILVRAYLQDRQSLPSASAAENYEGAISLGNPGIYRNAYKVDVASLYPSIMIQYEVCDKEKDPKEYFKQLVSIFTEKRLYHKALAKKDKYHDDMQASYKILINSMYGFMGTAGLLFNSPKNAAFVTEMGREILTKAIDWSDRNNYSLVNCDTDSVSICRKDQQFIDEKERQIILDGINSEFPEKIKWEDDGFYPTFIVVKAKNYVLWDGKKLKFKGSALKATTKEKGLQEFIKKVIDVILENPKEEDIHKNCTGLYESYVKEIMNISDITRWASKKTITDKVLKNERTNESKVRDALEGSDYVEGDKVFIYFKEDGTLNLVENFNNDHDKKKLLKKLYKTSETFETILPVKDIFTNYALVKNYKILDNTVK